jgi:hypothetical protein
LGALESGGIYLLRYLNGTVQGSNVVDLVNVLRKRKYFNPQGWETFGEALREANVPQDLIGHQDRWRYITVYAKCTCPETVTIL